jgi:hypothetical protein
MIGDAKSEKRNLLARTRVTTMTGLGRRNLSLCKLFNHSWEEMDPVRRRCIHCNEIEYRVLNKNCNLGDPKYVWSKQQDLAKSDQHLR